MESSYLLSRCELFVTLILTMLCFGCSPSIPTSEGNGADATITDDLVTDDKGTDSIIPDDITDDITNDDMPDDLSSDIEQCPSEMDCDDKGFEIDINLDDIDMQAWEGSVNPCFTGRSLRIMTYNTALIFSYDSSIDIETRAGLLADEIFADAPDVVVLNEVFDNDCKSVFINKLCADPADPNNCMYPSFIYFLDKDGPLEDSGMMLFSRFRFGDVDGGVQMINGIQKYLNQGHSAQIAWMTFSDENGFDAWANKGVAVVRILNECNNDSPFNVAFTHLQSTDGGQTLWGDAEDFEDRQEQLADVRYAIEASVDKMLDEPIFVLGDLNIDGNLWGNLDDVAICNDDGVCVEQDYNEWEYTCDSTNPSHPIADRHDGFYAARGFDATYDLNVDPTIGTLLTDPWGFETSPLDPGQTYSGNDLTFPDPKSGERLDYILHNNPVVGGLFAPEQPQLCLQHITRGFTANVDYDVDLGHSDHLPLTADFNAPAPACSPHPRQNDPVNPNPYGPREVVFDPYNPSAPNHSNVLFANGKITYPGSMQWYVIDQAYPCEISIYGDHVAYDVYHGSDLSRPMAPWDGDCEEGNLGLLPMPYLSCTYTLYDPPYYVRVYAVNTHASDLDAVPDRTKSDLSYVINFHRFTCSSIEDACPVKPAVDSPAWVWPSGYLNPYADPPDDDTMFFVFTTEYSTDDSSPEITFLLESDFATSPNPLKMTLVDENGNVVCTAPDCPNNDGLADQVPSTTEWSADSDGDGLPERLAVAQKHTLPGEGGWPKRYYLKVHRDQQYLLDQKSVFVRYETSINYFRPTYLKCGEERTDLGDDDLDARFIFDTYTVEAPIPGLFTDGDKLYEAGTKNWWYTWPFELDGSFVDALQPWMLEDSKDYTFDSPVNGYWIHAVEKSKRIDDPVKTAHYTWSDESDADDAEYWYVMTYELSHQRPPCRADDDCESPRTCSFGACK